MHPVIRKLCIRIALGLSSLILTFLLVEITLRIYIHINPRFEQMVQKRYDSFGPSLHPYYGHYTGYPPFIPMPIKKNSPAEYIILILGGSTAFGTGAYNIDNCIPQQLEKCLNKKNEFDNLSRFVVVNAAHHGYHTTQEKNVFVQYITDKSDIDMVICINGFNNLVRPLENAAYELPLNYPGWYWIVPNRLEDKKEEFFYLLRYYRRLKKRVAPFNSEIIKTIAAHHYYSRMESYSDECLSEIISKVSSIPEEKQIQILYNSAEFYKDDILFISNLAKVNNIRALFVLQPLLGLERRRLTEYERNFCQGRRMYDFQLAPHRVWVSGHRRLQGMAEELKKHGIIFLDFTAIFRDLEENPFADLMHMNDTGQQIFAEKLADQVIHLLKEDFSK